MGIIGDKYCTVLYCDGVKCDNVCDTPVPIGNNNVIPKVCKEIGWQIKGKQTFCPDCKEV